MGRPPLGWAGLGRAGQSIRFSRASCSGFHASAPLQPIALLPSTSARAPTSAPPLRANNRRGRITSAPVQGRAGARGNTGSGALEGPIVLLGGALRTTRALPDGCWAQPCGRHLISSLTAQRNAMQRGEVRCETCCAEQPGRRRAFLLADGCCSLLLGHLLGQSEGAWTVRDGPINGICLGDGEPQPTRPTVRPAAAAAAANGLAIASHCTGHLKMYPLLVATPSTCRHANLRIRRTSAMSPFARRNRARPPGQWTSTINKASRPAGSRPVLLRYDVPGMRFDVT